MQEANQPPMVACINSSEDVVLLLRDLMVAAGFRAVTYVSPIRFGSALVIGFVTQLRPDVTIYTVSFPFEQSWQEFQDLQRAYPNCAYVCLTTNERALAEMIGPSAAIELVGKPFDIDHIVDVVRQAIAARG